MTRILALDTSSWWGSVALVRAGPAPGRPEVVAELGLEVRDSHSIHLLSWIDRLLSDAGWSRWDLDAFAAVCGPGSFTGIRVGLGTVRGLELATGRPAVGVTTLEALAEAHGPASGLRMPVMDAGRKELYAAVYDADSSPPVTVEAPWLDTAEAALQTRRPGGAVLIPAPGSERVLPDGERPVRAPRGIAAAAGCLAALHGTGALPPLSPLYLRPPDALLKRPRQR